jgi:hypothetical protein
MVGEEEGKKGVVWAGGGDGENGWRNDRKAVRLVRVEPEYTTTDRFGVWLRNADQRDHQIDFPG